MCARNSESWVCSIVEYVRSKRCRGSSCKAEDGGSGENCVNILEWKRVVYVQ